jgi:RHS repeat-associated protein
MWDAMTGGNQIQSVALEQSGGAPTNRIASVTSGGATVNYSYDAAGNVTNDGVHGYTYDAENRLVSVDGGGTGQYSYDQQNRRYKKVVGSAVTDYVWEGSRVLAEHNGSTGAVITDYVYRGNQMVAKVEGGVTSYFLSDRLSVRLVLDASGSVVGRQGHLPYGEDFGESGSQDKHHFTAYERDSETALDYAVARSYNSAVARFGSVDKLSGNIFNPQRLNRFSYTRNDPINRTDHLGMDDYCQTDPVTGETVCGPNESMDVPAGPDDPFADDFFRNSPVGPDGFIDPRDIQGPPRNPPNPRPINIPNILARLELRSGVEEFLKDNPSCKTKFEQRGWNISQALTNVSFFDVNVIAAERARNYFPDATSRRQRVEDYFSAEELASGFHMLAITNPPGFGRPGIYTRGGITAFLGPIGDVNSVWLTHELLHYASGLGDAALGSRLGAPPPAAGHSWSESITAYLDNGCLP